MLKSAVVYFTWQPPAAGFQWVSGQAVTDDWLIDEQKVLVLVPNGFPKLFKHYGRVDSEYEPLKVASGLFREFAAIDADPEPMMAFADRYGPLTRGELFAPVDAKLQQFPKPPAACKLAYSRLRPESPEGLEASQYEAAWVMKGAHSGDSIATWRNNIRRLRALIALWDAIQQRKTTEIEKYADLSVKNKKQVIVLRDETGELEDPVTFSPDSNASLKVAAEHALITAIALQIRYTNSLDLFPPGSRNARKLAIVPHSLLDAIWLQFGLAVLEDKKFRECEVCGKPFELSPQVARTNRTLCSGACKARAHRNRHERALSLAAKGLKPKEIAEKVGSQLSTVKKWLSQAKE